MSARREWLKQMMAGAVGICAAGSWAEEGKRPPNIVLIIADDIGYGDLGCYGAMKVKTPNLDRLARQGRRFTDAHSTAAVCTPTRYSLLTGQYAWRNPAGDHILSGMDPLSIPINRSTAASLLKQAGYRTGIVGKWHLGLGSKEKPVDFNAEIIPGPLDIGFDYAFIIPATGDRVPCVYVENRRVVGHDATDPIAVSYGEKIGNDPTGLEHPELLKIKADISHSKTIVNGISRIGYMSGGAKARWVDEDIADTLARKAADFIQSNANQPFFLYLATHDIHEPMAPHARFKGSSACGSRGDVIQELDWTVGEVMKTLDQLALAEDTLILFSSDNGGAIKDTYEDGTNHLHALQPPNGELKGEKASLWEGGHRIPFIARWPGRIQAGSESDALIGLVDMPATFAAIAGVQLQDEDAPDSINILPVLTGKSAISPRDHLVLQSNGSKWLAMRQGQWKLITAAGETQNGELYDLASDPQESRNAANKHPGKLAELLLLLKQTQDTARTRP